MHKDPHDLPLNREPPQGHMRSKCCKGGLIAILIAPVKNRARKSDLLPGAELKIGHDSRRIPLGRDHQNKGAFVAHETMSQSAGEIRPRHQCQRVNGKGFGQLLIVGKRKSHRAPPAVVEYCIQLSGSKVNARALPPPKVCQLQACRIKAAQTALQIAG